MPTFNENLAFGKIAESQIALWLRRARGWAVLPVYEVEQQTGKGPRFFAPRDELIAPDMIAMRGDRVRWIEAKHKTVFSWWGKGKCFETGIDLHHYEHYQRIASEYPFEVWLLFLHVSDETDTRDIVRWDAPARCPVGLFGGTVPYLSRNESHRDDRHGPSGMVYWKHNTLRLIATLDEVQSAASAEWARAQARDTLRALTLSGRQYRENP